MHEAKDTYGLRDICQKILFFFHFHKFDLSITCNRRNHSKHSKEIQIFQSGTLEILCHN